MDEEISSVLNGLKDFIKNIEDFNKGKTSRIKRKYLLNNIYIKNKKHANNIILLILAK